jgi:murein L,D-transpeptidase YafK
MLRLARITQTALGLSLVFFQACGHAKPQSPLEMADKIVIMKSAHTLTLMRGTRLLRVYKIAIGRNSVGAKMRSGDHKTPEGNYIIDSKKSDSKFDRALHISYPNQADRQRALRAGVNPGGDIEIHGLQNGLGWIGGLHRKIDWTDGCIAVTDKEIEEIWVRTPVGTPVEIKP